MKSNGIGTAVTKSKVRYISVLIIFTKERCTLIDLI